MPERRDVDERGRVFVGYRTVHGKKYEWWASSQEAFDRREVRRYEAIKRWTAEKKKDPAFRKKLSVANTERNKINRENDPARFLLYGARCRAKGSAKRSTLDFDIDKSDCIVPTHCPILGIPLYPSRVQSSDNSPELDRIDNTKGYVKGNVWVISRRANRIKNDATLDELRLLVGALAKKIEEVSVK